MSCHTMRPELASHTKPASERASGAAVMARTLGGLYLAGAVIGAASLLLPHAVHADVRALSENIGFAALGGTLLMTRFARAPRWTFHVAVLAGTLTITRAIYYSGHGVSYYAVWYVWVALFSFYYFSRGGALGHCSAVAASYAWVLAIKHEADGPARWVVTVGTVLMTGLFIDALGRRIRAQGAERLELLNQLQALATTDELTRLPNRRAWRQTLTRELELARRRQSSLCVAMIDLDGFKSLNDRYGHLAGDRALQTLADVWRTVLRPGDTLARYGGDEFVVLLPGCDRTQAQQVIDRLSMASADHEFSVGIAVWRGQSAEALLADADHRLYAVKRARAAALAPPPGRTPNVLA